MRRIDNSAQTLPRRAISEPSVPPRDIIRSSEGVLPTMAVTAALLRELHRCHRQLADLRERHERGPKQIKAHETNVKRLEDEVAKVKADALAARKAVDNKQLT